MLKFHAEIVRINGGAKLDFLNFGGVLMLARFLIFLGLFVAEFAEVNEPANRRGSVRGNLDEIDALLPGQVQALRSDRCPLR